MALAGSSISRGASGPAAHAREARIFNGRGIQVVFPSTMDEIERRVIETTLEYTHGDKSQAARLLNIGRKTLYRKLEQYESES